MFIPARTHRLKPGVMQRLLQSLSNRSLSTLEVLQQMSALEIRVLRPTLTGTLCVVIIVLITFMLQSQIVLQINHLVVAIQQTILLLGALMLRRHLQHALGEANAQERERAAAEREIQTLRQAVQWQQELSTIANCVSLEELRRRATSHSLTIGGGSQRRLATMSDTQSTALQMLSTVIALRSSALELLAWREQQRQALDSLWHIAGLLRIPGATQGNLLQEPLRQLAQALDLDWLVLLAPHSHAPIAAVLTVFGHATPGATLSAAQLRVATEALRSEQPLVRHEGPAALACLPILRVGHAPMVMVARGGAAEEATQSILLLLGDLLAHHYEQANELGA